MKNSLFGVNTLTLYIAQLNEIKEKFVKRIKCFRTLYMSLLVQEEQAALHILENESINSIYLSERNKFVFGERFIDDPTFYTDVDVTDCVDALFNVEETLNEIKRILILKLTAIHEDYYRSLVKYYHTQRGDSDIEKIIKKYDRGSPEERLHEIQKLFECDFCFSSEYKELNFLFRMRNRIAHEDGIISEKYFEEYATGIGNINPYRKKSNKHGTVIKLGEMIIISDYDFSELIWLVELVGNNVFSSIIRECPYVEQ